VGANEHFSIAERYWGYVFFEEMLKPGRTNKLSVENVYT